MNPPSVYVVSSHVPVWVPTLLAPGGAPSTEPRSHRCRPGLPRRIRERPTARGDDPGREAPAGERARAACGAGGPRGRGAGDGRHRRADRFRVVPGEPEPVRPGSARTLVAAAARVVDRAGR